MSKVYTGMDRSGSYRVYLALTTDMVEEARKIHDTTPLATAGLGRVLTGAGLMGLMLKNEKDKLTVIFKGDGPAKQILATATADGRVKGYIANPAVDLPLNELGKLDVGGSLGIGDLTVIKDLGMKEPYVGTIALATGEIADDLTAYYFISEQQNSAISLGVKIDTDYSVLAAGGMIIQMLPGFKDEAVDALEKMIAELPPITTIIEEAVNAGTGKSEEGILADMMERIFGEMPEDYMVTGLEYRDMGWECDCSEERLEKVLMTIGVSDLKEIIEEDGQAEMVCQFCCKKYHFDKPHLERILASVM
ncbi:MAG: Hsp33 family molecular chaperone HslO [Firmicutes bacterium]|nr:Hsp33 family molecular chaperone HslO [Bacillota bacterium]